MKMSREEFVEFLNEKLKEVESMKDWEKAYFSKLPSSDSETDHRN